MAAPGQQQPTDQTASFFWIMIIIVGVAMLLWWLEKRFIVSAIFHWRYYEIDFLKYCVEGLNDLLQYFHLPTLDMTPLESWQDYMRSATVSDVRFKDLMDMSTEVGDWLRVPVIVCFVIFSAILYLRGGTTRFKHIYSMRSLRDAEVGNWPQIVPVSKLDLVKESLTEGPWAMAMQPLEFCKAHNLAKPDKVGEKMVWVVDRQPAMRVFTLQLGPLFRNLQVLPVHVKALMVIFIAKAERHRDVATGLIEQIGKSSATGKLDFSGVNIKLAKYQHSKILQWVLPRHAYVLTMMATLLEVARSDGVLATSEFLWLKPLDRRLWYMLNCTGRQTPLVEVAGPFAHWLAEKKLACALRVPIVKEAANALEVTMKDVLYINKDDQWQRSED